MADSNASSQPDLPELYDLDTSSFDDDLPMYEAFAHRGAGAVLELGCGTGRAAISLAGGGFEVWGIDSSEPMLERARCKAGDDIAGQLHFRHADMRDFDLGRTFGLIFCGYGAFHHLLTPDDQLACLRRVRAHLAPNGRFVCDLRAALHAVWEPGEHAPLLHGWTRDLLSSGRSVTMLRAVTVDRATQVQRELRLYDCQASDGTVRRVTQEVALRFTTRYEMEALLREAGLALDGLYGGYDLTPYNDASDLMITVARIAKDSA